MKITIIDDHDLVLDSVKAFLENQPEIEEVTTYTSAKSFLASYVMEGAVPDVVVADLRMPEMDGLTFINQYLKQKAAKTKILVLSSISDTQIVKQAIRSGINGFLSKSSTTAELITALKAVDQGQLYIGENLRNVLLNDMLTAENVTINLSPREKEVLQKICTGATIKEIAHEMELSKHTVQSYQRLIMKKLKIRRSAELVLFAMKNGMFIPDTIKSL